MSRRFTLVTIALTSAIAFFLGLMVAGEFTASPVVSGEVPPRVRRPATVATSAPFVVVPATVNFADVAAQLNPAVVNVDAVSRRRPHPKGRPPGVHPWERSPDEESSPGDPDTPDEGAGSGFIIDADGYVLTNHHVVDGAERITVKLADGRSLRARVVGSDAPTDIALLKVDSPTPLPVAPLGDSSSLRVGEWVCAIGNPLAYEHTVTVGVVSYLGRKLFDASLDDYIQTDAAINFGNSGGPLINARGEVIGINAAISWKASSIGFAIPINQATAILPQLKANGRVTRGYLGITLRDLDPDLGQSLGLDRVTGALIQDVSEGSPGERAGLHVYDVILSVDGEDVKSNDDLIRRIAARAPGTTVRLRLLRDGREQAMAVRLTERPLEQGADAAPVPAKPRPVPARPDSGLLGVVVREVDKVVARRLQLPEGLQGVIVTSIDPLTSAYEAGLDRGDVILEVNRQPVRTTGDFARLTSRAVPGQVLAVYCYVPDLGQRALRAVRVEGTQQ
jgi:Do/DeqQ family serine protease